MAITIPNTFSNATTALGSWLDANFTTIANFINNSLDAAVVKDSVKVGGYTPNVQPSAQQVVVLNAAGDLDLTAGEDVVLANTKILAAEEVGGGTYANLARLDGSDIVQVGDVGNVLNLNYSSIQVKGSAYGMIASGLGAAKTLTTPAGTTILTTTSFSTVLNEYICIDFSSLGIKGGTAGNVVITFGFTSGDGGVMVIQNYPDIYQYVTNGVYQSFHTSVLAKCTTAGTFTFNASGVSTGSDFTVDALAFVFRKV